ncbi:MAG: fused MFS/spermidine synthase [Ignavibacteriales bacterium]|nr:fused MFS/spermidine synthase [Ignavibacteriales bacterium]
MDNKNASVQSTGQTASNKYLYTIGFFALVILAIISFVYLFSATIPVRIGDQAFDKYQVLEKDDGRYLLVNGQPKQFIDPTDLQSFTRYAAVMELPMHLFINPGKMFLSGLGSGSLARSYSAKGWKVEVADPDSALLNIDQTFFGFNRAKIQLSDLNGRKYLEEADSTYDVILVDCISQGGYPRDQMTKEFFKLSSQRLTKEGIFAIAFESTGWKDDIVKTLSATLKQVFNEVYVYPIVEPPDVFGSIVIMSSNTPHNDLIRDLTRNDRYDPYWRYGNDYQKVHAWDNRFTSENGDGIILTDDKQLSRLVIERLQQASWRVPKDYLP